MSQLSGNVLAFIGDAVLSLQVRQHLVAQGITKTKQLQELSTRFVSAKSQALFMKNLLENDVYKKLIFSFFSSQEL